MGGVTLIHEWCLHSTFPSQIRMFWWLSITKSKFPTPARPNQRFSDNGTKVAIYHELINMAIGATFTLSFGGSHTPRTCLLRLVGAVLCKSPGRDWNVGREMKGWRLGEWPVLPPYDDDSGDDLSDE